MAGTEAFRVEGVVVEVLSQRTCRVELSNGHRLLGFWTARARGTPPALSFGQTVKLQLTPYDLSTGRLLVEPK